MPADRLKKPQNIMDSLDRLHVEIDERVQAIRSSHPDWLCRRGCDGCCYRLAEIPRLTVAEWARLREGIAALPPEQLQEVGRNIATLVGLTSRPIVCPLLDRSTGACQVYTHRPVACRTYGFYVQRDQGLYCKDIEARVSAGTLADVVWGNQDIIDRRLSHLGASRELTEWFIEWMNDPGKGQA